MPPDPPALGDAPVWAKLPWLTRNVLTLGLVSFFNDASSEMIIPLLPAFVTSVLGGGALALGWIEGTADMVASLLKLASGWLADRTGRNRPLVVTGYVLASVARPFIAAAQSPLQVLAIRTVDRTGKGLRTSPRDAIIAGSVPAARRGTAFGFHEAMDHAGAVVGPVLALVVLAAGAWSLRAVFWWSAVPAALAVIVLLVGLREPERPRSIAPRGAALLSSLPPSLWRFLVPLGVFTLSNSTDVFLLLKAGAERTPLYGLPLLWIGLHIVRSLSSVPGGRLSDAKGPKVAISLGWAVYAAVYVGFAFASTQLEVAALFVVYGLYSGLTAGAEKALVAQAIPAAVRGTAFGWYYLTVGLVTLPASLLFGGLWDAFGSRVAFLTGAGLAALALGLLWAMVPRRPVTA